MHRSNPSRRTRTRLLSLAVVAAVGVTGPAAVPAAARDAEPRPAVAAWIRAHAEPLATTDPAAALDDLVPLRRLVGGATVVGLGESTHGSREQALLKHRTIRFLVEELGFRSIAWEDDWTLGLQLDRYLVTGEGDLDGLMRQMARTWHSAEVREVLRWLREYNATHRDKVRFVGVEFFATRDLAYDAVAGYVAESAPERVAELEAHLAPLRPRFPTIGEHVGWYYNLGLPEKQPYIDHARQVYELVEGTPHRRGDRAWDLALQHARQIRSFYEYFALQGGPMVGYRDARAAENLRWWQRRTGDKVAYWAAGAHTANAPGLEFSAPPSPPTRWDSAGSHLRRWYGQRYRSIGFTFDHGTVFAGAGRPPYAVPRPPSGWADRQLGDAGLDRYLLDLRAAAPAPVRAWRQAPTRIRAVAAFDATRPDEFYMAGGSLAQWFDLIVHRQVVTPYQPL